MSHWKTEVCECILYIVKIPIVIFGLGRDFYKSSRMCSSKNRKYKEHSPPDKDCDIQKIMTYEILHCFPFAMSILTSFCFLFRMQAVLVIFN